MYGIICYLTKDEARHTFSKFIEVYGGHYIAIEHAYDENKITHVHCILDTNDHFDYNRLKTILQELSQTKQNFMVTTIKNISKSLEYLCHINNPKKAQYKAEEVFFDSAQHWKEVYTSPHDDDTVFLQELLSTNFSARRMAEKYGKDFIKNAKSYIYFRELVMEEERENRIQENAYLQAIEHQKHLALLRKEEINKIIDIYPDITEEEIGDYTLRDYQDLQDWCRWYRRSPKNTDVRVYFLRHLPHREREAMEKLIYKRMSEGIYQFFFDIDPRTLTLVEKVNGHHIPKESKIRKNIYISQGEIA